MKDVASSADGIPIHYEVHGDGSPALVLVHGWSCDRSYWRAQVGPLGRRHRVVTIDLAGHGESGVGRPSWTMAAFGADVVAVLDGLDLNDVVLVGHSMGGDVIVEAALLLGGRVRGLVWVDTYPTLAEPQSPEQVEAFAEPFRADFAGHTRAFMSTAFPATSDPALVEWVVSDMASAPPAIALDALVHAFGNQGPVIDALPRISAPLVQISPDYEPTDVESLASYGIRTAMMSNVGHFLMLEDPGQFNSVLEDVIEGFARPGP
jgi:pimeloyl-ACP methyl ester carboxylesterase